MTVTCRIDCFGFRLQVNDVFPLLTVAIYRDIGRLLNLTQRYVSMIVSSAYNILFVMFLSIDVHSISIIQCSSFQLFRVNVEQTR